MVAAPPSVIVMSTSRQLLIAHHSPFVASMSLPHHSRPSSSTTQSISNASSSAATIIYVPLEGHRLLFTNLPSPIYVVVAPWLLAIINYSINVPTRPHMLSSSSTRLRSQTSLHLSNNVFNQSQFFHLNCSQHCHSS